MIRQFLNPWNYAVALLIFVIIRYFLFRILFHLSALFACVVLYGFYSSLKKLFRKDEIDRRSRGTAHLFLTDEEGRAVGKAHGTPLRQFPLASATGWKKYRQNSKETYNTVFFSKIIRNEQMEAALRKLLSFVTKDFIHPWYFKSISSNQSFPNYIDFVLHSAVAELYNRALSIDVPQLILIKIVGVITTHIREVQNAERLLRASRLPNSRNQEELNRQLAQHYNQGKLHPALNASSPDTTQHEYTWFRKRLKPFIPLLIPRKETSSGIIHVLVREILITCLLRPIVNNFSQPDYWNQLFDNFGGYLLDQQQQNRLLRKPSEYIPDHTDQGDLSKGDLPSFDVYLRQMGTCTNLPDAYKIRDNIIKEIDVKGVSIGNLLFIGSWVRAR
jgi:sorting nexin-25